MSEVVVAHADIKGVENLFRTAVIEALGDHKDALKAFEVSMFQPQTLEQGELLKKLGKRLFQIEGALGLNDSGEGWKVFQIQMEEGLTDAEDKDVAQQLGHQCLVCVAQMRREQGLSNAAIAQRHQKRRRNHAA